MCRCCWLGLPSFLLDFRYLIAHPPPVHRIFLAPESFGYRLVIRIGDPYRTREIIVVGDGTNDHAIPERDHFPDVRGDHRERMVPIDHNQ